MLLCSVFHLWGRFDESKPIIVGTFSGMMCKPHTHDMDSKYRNQNDSRIVHYFTVWAARYYYIWGVPQVLLTILELVQHMDFY